jgi:NAD(P)-dependent dehydrogenase (short-subunit alcohol dehydrogenase family)
MSQGFEMAADASQVEPASVENEKTSDPFSLNGRTVLLTGASVGLGRRFAEVLGRSGALVAVVARRQDALEDLASRVPGCIPFPFDLSAVEGIPKLVEEIESRLGCIDILINNAGIIGDSRRAEDERLEDVRTLVEVNLIAPIMLAQAVFPSMSGQGYGNIVNVTSVVADLGIARFPQASYSATKGALKALTRAWAVQWWRYGIRVNALAPGLFENSMNAEMMRHERVQKWVDERLLVKRPGIPQDLDGAILFLASEASAYMTGQTIVVDGGWTAH